MLARARERARALRREAHALWLAGRDPRVPWHAKALATLVAGYALSPIDLIPDFIPVVGYLDDAILVPLGILLVIRLIPPLVMAEHRALPRRRPSGQSVESRPLLSSQSGLPRPRFPRGSPGASPPAADAAEDACPKVKAGRHSALAVA